MTIKTTSKLTKATIILYFVFIPLNLFEVFMKIWEYFILSSTMNLSEVRIYYYAIDFQKFERPFHGILNLASNIVLIVWFNKVYRLMREIDPEFKANRVMVFIFWLIPVYQAIYMYVAFRKIIMTGSRHVTASKRINKLNLVIFVCYLSVWIIYLSWIAISPITNFVLSSVFQVLISAFGLIVSIFTILFFRNYLKLERKLVSNHFSEPELTETGLIDG